MTNHAIVSIVDGEAAKVRCRSCYHDHTYLKEQIPPSKKDLKKLELYNAVLAGSGAPAGDSNETVADPTQESDSPEASPPSAEEETVTAADSQAKKPRGRARKA
jgi:hypothetical protein